MDNLLQNTKDLLDRISDAFLALDKDWNISYVNRKGGEIAGKNPADLLGKNIWEEFPEAVGSVFHNAFDIAMNEQKFQHARGYYPPLDLWLEVQIYPSPEGVTALLVDISEQKRSEEKVLKANRLYNFISQVDQMIVRVTDESSLYRQACQIAVNTGKFKMAWIGLIDEDTREVNPVTHAGDERDYLSVIAPISSREETPEGRGPTGTAIREGRSVICNDIENDPHMEPWRTDAIERGYHSSIALPIRRTGKVIGAFNLYAAAVNYFDKDEIALLEETADDITFALENIQREELRRKTLQELTVSEERYRLIFENSLDGILLTRPDGRIMSANSAACAIFGMSEQELCAGGRDALIDPVDADLVKLLEERTRLGKAKGELMMRRKNGERFPVEITSAIFRDAKGEEKTSMIIRDITDRKKAETEILEVNNQLRLLSDYLQRIREEERTSIAREIHDELGQQLTVMKMDVSWLAKHAGNGNQAINQRIADLKDMLDQTVKSVRRISSELRPSILDDMGLGAAIEWQLEEFGKRAGVKTKLDNQLSGKPLADELKTGLFRITQESLTNVGRYANAKNVSVNIREDAGKLELIVEDDGEGFDKKSVMAKKTLGILGMRERAAMIGGTFEIKSAPGKGTKVIVKVPSGS